MTVRCSDKISATCIYGVSRFERSKALGARCNYILCEGHMRGCSPDQCDKYVKIDKDHPRKLSLSDVRRRKYF